MTTSTQFLELDELPARIAFVGGGYIPFEFAHIAARAGASVQVLHQRTRPLEKFDPDRVARLVQTSRELGIEIHLNMAVTAIERQGDHSLVHARTGQQEQVHDRLVLLGAGGPLAYGQKVLIEEGTDRILGAHLLELYAEEVINIFALAMRTGLHAGDLKSMVSAYPTSASDVSYVL